MLRDLGFPVQCVPLPRWLHSGGSDAPIRRLDADQAGMEPLREAVGRLRPDALHTNSLVTPAGALAARAWGIPHVWHVREFGDLDYALEWTVDRDAALAFVGASGPVVCVSDAVRRHHFPGDRTPCVRTVHNGVFPRSRMARSVRGGSGPGGSVVRFAVVGRVMPQKAQHVAIEALALARRAVPGLRLTVVGEGRCGYAGQLRALAERLGLTRAVNFAGEVEDREAIYADADAVVVCSVMEAMGRVAAEAMALGVPVVARSTGGSPELVDDGESGLLFDGSPEDLARRMVELSSDRAFADRLAARALERARARFASERYCAAIADIHRSARGRGANGTAGSPGGPTSATFLP